MSFVAVCTYQHFFAIAAVLDHSKAWRTLGFHPCPSVFEEF